MPMFNHNDPAAHDGTYTKTTFGGPYEIYVSINGQTLDRGEVGKGDELVISIEPVGKTGDENGE